MAMTPSPASTQPTTGRVARPTQRQNSAGSGRSLSRAGASRTRPVSAVRSAAMGVRSYGGAPSDAHDPRRDAQSDERERERQIQQVEAVRDDRPAQLAF